MDTIEKILISKGELDRIYIGELKLYLWRSLHKTTKPTNPLYPDFESREVRTGVVRGPDIEVKPIGGLDHVIARLGQGTSLFDKPNTFGDANWIYFEIPEGTEIPKGLIITKDSYNSKFKATHYSISPNHTMPKLQFIKLLDKLADNAQKQKWKLQHARNR